jgi:hypothetical protein
MILGDIMNKIIRNTLALAAFATATACSSTTETVITTPTTTTGTTTYTGTTTTGTTGTTTSTTTTGDDYLVPYTYSIAAYFGYDAADGTLKAGSYGGTEFPAEIVVSVLDERYYDAYNEMYTCDVTISVPAGTMLPGWVGETLSYDDKGATVTTFIGIAQEEGFKTSEVCGMELDPMSGFSSASELLGGGWTLGVAEMNTTPDIEEALMGYFEEDEWNADWAPYVLAGGMVFEDYAATMGPTCTTTSTTTSTTTGTTGTTCTTGSYSFYDSSYGFAYETNADLELQLDGKGYSTSLQSAQAAATMPTAWYEIYSFYGYYL